jgi:hypothetical protein
MLESSHLIHILTSFETMKLNSASTGPPESCFLSDPQQALRRHSAVMLSMHDGARWNGRHSM